MGPSHFTELTCPWVGAGQIVGFIFLPYFDFVAAGGILMKSMGIIQRYAIVARLFELCKNTAKTQQID